MVSDRENKLQLAFSVIHSIFFQSNPYWVPRDYTCLVSGTKHTPLTSSVPSQSESCRCQR